MKGDHLLGLTQGAYHGNLPQTLLSRQLHPQLDYFGELLSLLLGALGGESLFELLQAAHAAVGKHLRLFLFIAVVLACGV